MTARDTQTEHDAEAADIRVTLLDNRLLHMTREEAKAHLETYLQQRRLVDG